MKTSRTYWANIYVGFREGYSDTYHTFEEAKDICQKYVDEVGLCATITPTDYIYTNKGVGGIGYEPGVIIGLINYPRFPSVSDVRRKALELAGLFLREFKQNRVTVMFSDHTVMLEREDLDE